MLSKIDVHINTPMLFERGKSYCIEAASGVGKSSLLHFIGGFRTDYNGQILLDGKDIKTLSANERSRLYREELAYLFQDLRLFPTLTAYENVRKLFARLGISDKWDAPVRLMSWGQQQRVAAIRALCQPCSFMLLDEPVSHLDEDNAQILGSLIHEEQATRHFGIIATSVGKPLPIEYDQTIQL